MLLEKGSRLRLLESLRYRVRDAQLWSQLSLFPSLEISEASRLSNLKPDFSIRLGPDKASPSSASQPRVWLPKDINIRHPNSLPNAELARLQICLGFHMIPGEHMATVKRVRGVPVVNEHVDIMLLDQTPAGFGNTHLHEFQGIVERPNRDLPEPISRCFETLESDNITRGSVPFGQSSTPLQSQSRHRDSEGQDDMLLSTSWKNSLKEIIEPPEEDMLLSQWSSSTPSLGSQSTLVSDLSPWPPPSSLKRAASELQILNRVETPPSLDVSSAYKLTEAAMQILISGYDSHRLRVGDMKIDGPLPEKSLSKLAPVIFSPGFRDSMANNVRFIPTISQAISSTLLRNVQSPSLRKKLIGLANLATSTPQKQNMGPAYEASGCLAAVAQARLWSMMQRKLYDPSESKKLSWKTSYSADQATAIECEDQQPFEDLLVQVRDENGQATEDLFKGDPEELIEGEFSDIGDDFEDLLDDIGDDDDELLEYLDKIETGRMKAREDAAETSFDSSFKKKASILLFAHETADEFMLV
ncbi:uncharacterized protein BP5553_05427 [Venustampulla echinocandica]|uniref:Uncharacterized protein n=1 Tax=Venustampulla echinocandica TaxID=2656787 RepID=A0A370TR62_9HELO|nr:uncharacterized protein BP5553_05427 [Venustampulla echinocandica]RDL37994.1 hypothetical protein BP5553_05427 [Venustampulla echinocandica]